MVKTGLFTDYYELTMLSAALKSGKAHRKATFELFTRRLPAGSDYGVVAGTERALQAVEDFSFTEEDLELIEQGMLSSLPLTADREDDVLRTVNYLRNFKFQGDIVGYLEGETYAPYSPVFQVSGTFGECVVLETVLLSIFNWDSAVATRASRCVRAASGRKLLEMGSRRTHEEAAVAAARASYIAGFTSSSNVAAWDRYAVPVFGTVAHAFILSHSTEREAFENQVKMFGPRTIFLVDTYDTEEGIKTALEVAGDKIGGVRIDSGDLHESARMARRMLDNAGATEAMVVLSGDMDETTIAALNEGVPADAVGVGTSLVTSPPPGFVYKLVAIEDDQGNMTHVAKRAVGKVSVGGFKRSFRIISPDGLDRHEVITNHESWVPDEAFRHMQHPLFKEGKRVMENANPMRRAAVDAARDRHDRALALLPDNGLQQTQIINKEEL